MLCFVCLHTIIGQLDDSNILLALSTGYNLCSQSSLTHISKIFFKTNVASKHIFSSIHDVSLLTANSHGFCDVFSGPIFFLCDSIHVAMVRVMIVRAFFVSKYFTEISGNCILFAFLFWKVAKTMIYYITFYVVSIVTTLNLRDATGCDGDALAITGHGQVVSKDEIFLSCATIEDNLKAITVYKQFYHVRLMVVVILFDHMMYHLQQRVFWMRLVFFYCRVCNVMSSRCWCFCFSLLLFLFVLLLHRALFVFLDFVKFLSCTHNTTALRMVEYVLLSCQAHTIIVLLTIPIIHALNHVYYQNCMKRILFLFVTNITLQSIFTSHHCISLLAATLCLIYDLFINPTSFACNISNVASITVVIVEAGSLVLNVLIARVFFVTTQAVFSICSMHQLLVVLWILFMLFFICTLWNMDDSHSILMNLMLIHVILCLLHSKQARNYILYYISFLLFVTIVIICCHITCTIISHEIEFIRGLLTYFHKFRLF